MLYDVDISELIEKTAEELKKIAEIKPPEWAVFVKTGVHKERPPANKDWWYTRAASILRIVDKLGAVGVSKLRTKYGGKKNKGAEPERFYKGSGNIIRKILQQLEKAELVKKQEKAIHKGRIITAKGVSLLNTAAKKIERVKPVKAEKKIVLVKKEDKKEEVKAEKPTEVKKPKQEKTAEKEVKKEQKTAEKKEVKPVEKKEESKKEEKIEVKTEEKKPTVVKAEEHKD